MKHVLSSALVLSGVLGGVLGVVSLGTLEGCKATSSQQVTPDNRAAMLEPLPTPARLALERLTEGNLTNLSTDEFEGREVYTATYTTATGAIGHAQVSSDGRVLSNYAETSNLAMSEAPEPVQAAIRAHTGGAALQTIAVERHGERDDRYIAMADLSGKKHRYEFNSTGSLISEATQIRVDQIPPAPLATLEARFPGLAGKKASVWEIRDRQGMISYAVEGWSKEKKVKVTVGADGKAEQVLYLK